MSPTEATAVFSAITAAIAAIFVPIYLNRRKTQATAGQLQLLDSREVAKMMRSERDQLRQQLNEATQRYEQQIRDLKADYEAKLAAAERKHQEQIADLRAQINELYRQLYAPRTPRSEP